VRSLSVWLEGALEILSPASWAPSIWSPCLHQAERRVLGTFLEFHFQALTPLPGQLSRVRRALEVTETAASECLKACPSPCRADLDALETAVLDFREAVSNLPKNRQAILDGLLR